MQPLSNQAVSKGVQLSLGLLNLPVSVYAAVGEDKSSATTNVCVGHPGEPHDPNRIRQTWTCPTCQSTSGFATAKVVDDGLVVIPQGVLDQQKAAAEALKGNVDITVHPIVEVTGTLMPSGKSYYLKLPNPTKPARETYRTLAALIVSRPDLAFLTKLTLRTATSLFQVVVSGEGTLTLRQFADASLVREHPTFEDTEIPQGALELAEQLAEMQKVPFSVETHGMSAPSLIAAYAAGQTPVTTNGAVVAADTATITDLTAHLAALVAAGQPKPTRKPRARKAATTKAAKATVKAS